MFKNRALVALLFLLSAMSVAQVVSPNEIKDPELRALQVQYSYDLTEVGKEILADKFEYPFYLSRKLDLDQEQQKRADQRGIRFDRYGDQIVVAISGNYYAAYSAEKVNADHRAQKSFMSVVMPVLKATVPRFQNNASVQGYAVEISHHVIGTAMGVTMEQPENMMVFLPQADAIKLVGSKDEETQQAALLEGKAFVNGDPVSIWLSGEAPPPGVTYPKIESSTTAHSAPVTGAVAQNQPVVAPQKVDPPPPPPRDTSAVALAELQTSKQATLDKLVKDLGPQAHFVSYAEQSFVAFREGIYLELSLATDLPESANGSRYKIAANAFDEHIAHLVRPALTYFKNDADFDGISFSTTVKVAPKGKTPGASEAVEFFFPFTALRCYEKYDCTGQQLIDGGTVLINGERVALDLQNAEGVAR
jgi:hypothetical protein